MSYDFSLSCSICVFQNLCCGHTTGISALIELFESKCLFPRDFGSNGFSEVAVAPIKKQARALEILFSLLHLPLASFGGVVLRPLQVEGCQDEKLVANTSLGLVFSSTFSRVPSQKIVLTLAKAFLTRQEQVLYPGASFLEIICLIHTGQVADASLI